MTDATDPTKEPTGGEVDDWHGQQVERDTEIAEQALADAGGDEEAAERTFDERTSGGGSD